MIYEATISQQLAMDLNIFRQLAGQKMFYKMTLKSTQKRQNSFINVITPAMHQFELVFVLCWHHTFILIL